MKIHDKQQRQQKTLHHLNRIQGQMNVLKKYIQEDRPCREIAQLTASITSSFSTLKMRTLGGYIQHELLREELPEDRQQELEAILKLFKK